MSERIRWAILGTGAIAAKFAAALQITPEAELVAIGSRSQGKADEFGRRFGVPKCFGGYQDLLDCEGLDAIYVATPHSCHKENAIAALRARKTVLVEKPFTINASEAAEVVAEAERQDLLVMEAMWTRWLPLYRELPRIIETGTIGDVRLMSADFGISLTAQEKPRLFDLSLGGGALLDVGVYPVSLASMLFGTPTEVMGSARFGPSGVDEEESIVIQHRGGQLAQLFSAITLATTLEVVITGTRGQLRIEAPFWKSTALTVTVAGQQPRRMEFPFPGNGYQFEAMEFMDCLRSGRKESATMPLAESIEVMKTMDRLRKQWGFRYPMEG